jgi:hypothetical protein
MNRFLSIVVLILFFTTSGFAQKKTSDFDIKDFSKKAQIAEWLYQYDAIAWWTSDSVMTQDSAELARLGSEWFCFQSQDKLWHAVYGKYLQNKFDLVFHFIVDEANKVKRIYEPIDTSILNPYSRALITANNQMMALKDSFKIRFNQFIKRNDDQTFTVWIFPAFQPDNYAVYGGEFIYTIASSGMTLLRDDSYYQGQFKAFKVSNPREVWIDFTELEKPTLGNVFFVWYYKSYFTQIKIDNKHFVTTAFKNSDGSYSWMHIAKDK